MTQYTQELYFEGGYSPESIYVLSHPQTDEIFYVGRTKKPLWDRLYQHCAKAKGKGDCFHNQPKNKYISDLLIRGLKPKISKVETITPVSYIEYLELYDREIYWMRYYESIGAPIFNVRGLIKNCIPPEYLSYLKAKKAGRVPMNYYYCGKDVHGNSLYDTERMKMDIAGKDARQRKVRIDLEIQYEAVKIAEKNIERIKSNCPHLSVKQLVCEDCGSVLISHNIADNSAKRKGDPLQFTSKAPESKQKRGYILGLDLQSNQVFDTSRLPDWLRPE